MIKVVLDDGAFMPTKAHASDAGWDLYSPTCIEIPACAKSIFDNSVSIGCAEIKTGVHIQLPEGTDGTIAPKSGLNRKGLLAFGTIDVGYTGEIIVKIYNMTDKPYTILRGDKITQLIIRPIVTDLLEVVDSLEVTERGDGGFGSSGR